MAHWVNKPRVVILLHFGLIHSPKSVHYHLDPIKNWNFEYVILLGAMEHLHCDFYLGFQFSSLNITFSSFYEVYFNYCWKSILVAKSKFV